MDQKEVPVFLKPVAANKENVQSDSSKPQKIKDFVSTLIEIVDSCCGQKNSSNKDPVFHVRFDVDKPILVDEVLKIASQSENQIISTDEKSQNQGIPIQSTKTLCKTTISDATNELNATTSSNTLTKAHKHGFPAVQITFDKRHDFRKRNAPLTCSMCDIQRKNADPRLDNIKYKSLLHSHCLVCFLPISGKVLPHKVDANFQNNPDPVEECSTFVDHSTTPASGCSQTATTTIQEVFGKGLTCNLYSQSEAIAGTRQHVTQSQTNIDRLKKSSLNSSPPVSAFPHLGRFKESEEKRLLDSSVSTSSKPCQPNSHTSNNTNNSSTENGVGLPRNNTAAHRPKSFTSGELDSPPLSIITNSQSASTNKLSDLNSPLPNNSNISSLTVSKTTNVAVSEITPQTCANSNEKLVYSSPMCSKSASKEDDACQSTSVISRNVPFVTSNSVSDCSERNFSNLNIEFGKKTFAKSLKESSINKTTTNEKNFDSLTTNDCCQAQSVTASPKRSPSPAQAGSSNTFELLVTDLTTEIDQNCIFTSTVESDSHSSDKDSSGEVDAKLNDTSSDNSDIHSVSVVKDHNTLKNVEKHNEEEMPFSQALTNCDRLLNNQSKGKPLKNNTREKKNTSLSDSMSHDTCTALIQSMKELEADTSKNEGSNWESPNWLHDNLPSLDVRPAKRKRIYRKGYLKKQKMYAKPTEDSSIHMMDSASLPENFSDKVMSCAMVSTSNNVEDVSSVRDDIVTSNLDLNDKVENNTKLKSTENHSQVGLSSEQLKLSPMHDETASFTTSNAEIESNNCQSDQGIQESRDGSFMDDHFVFKNNSYCWPFSSPSLKEIEVMSDCSSDCDKFVKYISVDLEQLESTGFVPKCFIEDLSDHECCSCCSLFCCSSPWIELG